MHHSTFTLSINFDLLMVIFPNIAVLAMMALLSNTKFHVLQVMLFDAILWNTFKAVDGALEQYGDLKLSCPAPGVLSPCYLIRTRF